jgi:hypothetical protein
VLVCQRLRCSSAQSVGSFVSFSDQEASIPHSRTMAGTASSFARTKTGSARRRGFGLVQRESGDQAGRRSTTAGTYPHWSVVTATDGIGINPGSSSPRPPGVTPVRPLSYVERPVQGFSSKTSLHLPHRQHQPTLQRRCGAFFRGKDGGRPQRFSLAV